MSDTSSAAPPPKKGWLRFVPIAAIVGILIAIRWSGLTDYFSFAALEEFNDALRAWSQANPLLGPLILVAVYAVGTASSVPGMVWVTLAAGFLFGTVVGTVSVVVGATIGAVIIFLAARYAFADILRAKAGRWLEKVDAEMQQGQVSYLLTVRLIPVIPFWIANLVPAFLDVKARTFAWTTFLGIIPVVAVYCSVGAGLGALLDSGQKPSLSGVLTDVKILLPLAGLICLSLLPILLRKVRGQKTASVQGDA